MNSKQYFEKNKYVVLSNAISRSRAQYLTDHMFSMFQKGMLVKDDQCPLSDAVYNDVEMNKLLQELAEPLGTHIGKKLLPTYAYARIYRKGEILKKHLDRPACEISATMTLGFNGKAIWPIFFENEYSAEIPAQLDIGDLALYRGCELPHWREPLKGEWHCQVFLHYVDADGPYKDHEGDQLNTQVASTPDTKKEEASANLDVPKHYTDAVIIPHHDYSFPGFYCFDSNNNASLMFTPQECDTLISYTKNAYSSSATVGGGDIGHLTREIRSAKIYNVDLTEENRWVFDRIAKLVALANKNHFDYDISGITHSLQLIHYDLSTEVPGHYDWHIDAGHGAVSQRKISVTVQLSDPSSYEGCDLEIYEHARLLRGSRDRGAVNMFPSYMPHRVSKITRGERYALVIWIHGRRFR